MTTKDELDPNVISEKDNEKAPKELEKKDQSRKSQNVNNLPIREYIDRTVVPVVLQGMAEVANVKPDNPLKYLADYLMSHSNEK